MKTREWVAPVTLFVVSAAIPMAFLTPRLARASTRTISGAACTQIEPSTTGGDYALCSNVAAYGYACDWVCVAPNDSVQYPGANLQGVYADGYLYDAGTVAIFLDRQSYTGTFSQDTSLTRVAASVPFDIYLAAANVKTSPSEWDYLWTHVQTYEDPGDATLFYGVGYLYSP
jgi:hypothetical protein